MSMKDGSEEWDQRRYELEYARMRQPARLDEIKKLCREWIAQEVLFGNTEKDGRSRLRGHLSRILRST
jgi:hypothetical protein